MSTSTFSGPVVSQAGFISGNANVIAAVTAATLTVDSSYNGQVIPLARAAGVTVTLPAATGSMACYKFIVTVAVTSNNDIVKVANSTDVMTGSAAIGGTTGAMFSTLAASDTISLNGSTTGGLIGSYVEVCDIAAGYWLVTVAGVGSGTPATPFSATV